MGDNMSNRNLRPESIAAHALHSTDPSTGAVVPPIHLSTTFARDENYETLIKDDYQRSGSPTLYQAEAILAALEQGESCLLYPSGMAAIFALIDTVPLGGHVVAPVNMYYGARVWLKALAEKKRITLTMIDMTSLEQLQHAVQHGKTDIVWIETPSNPTWDITDIAAAAKIAHAAGAVIGVDATMTAAVTTLPIKLGVDYVFHAVTKYLNGHSDILGGALIARNVDARWDQLRTARGKNSAPLAPFECWLLMRGMRTLFVRYRQACANAMTIARHFENHSKIDSVIYPGLESHPGHAIAARQMTDGFGGMISLLIIGGFEDAKRFCTRLNLIIPATSLGGSESLAEHRKSIEGETSPVPDNLVRLSIGIEHIDDLIGDIEQALARI
jgi:cystathionine gamma-synthase